LNHQNNNINREVVLKTSHNAKSNLIIKGYRSFSSIYHHGLQKGKSIYDVLLVQFHFSCLLCFVTFFLFSSPLLVKNFPSICNVLYHIVTGRPGIASNNANKP